MRTIYTLLLSVFFNVAISQIDIINNSIPHDLTSNVKNDLNSLTIDLKNEVNYNLETNNFYYQKEKNEKLKIIILVITFIIILVLIAYRFYITSDSVVKSRFIKMFPKAKNYGAICCEGFQGMAPFNIEYIDEFVKGVPMVISINTNDTKASIKGPKYHISVFTFKVYQEKVEPNFETLDDYEVLSEAILKEEFISYGFPSKDIFMEKARKLLEKISSEKYLQTEKDFLQYGKWLTQFNYNDFELDIYSNQKNEQN